MATVFYIRESAKRGRVTSSRDVSVEDLMSLYGSASSSYTYMKGADSPDIKAGKSPAADADPTHVIVRIEADEVRQDVFPAAGFYRVNNITP